MIYQVHEKHGQHIAYTDTEAKENEKNGWKTVSEKEFYGEPVTPEPPEAPEPTRAELVEMYMLKFGKAPHANMKDQTIRDKLDGA